mmetsp:Transcript_13119/g.24163  ORF Transcript_13119/g.24163 Transcript_13119/m.24163 type:complete len:386 (+) Transcript_13119:52-1209(+)
MRSSNRAPTRAAGAFGAFLAVLALTCTNCLTLNLDGADLPTFVNLFPRPCRGVDDAPLTETKSVPTQLQAMRLSRHNVTKPVAEEKHGLQHWLAVMAASLGMLLTVTLSPDTVSAEGYQFRQTIPLPKGPLDDTLLSENQVRLKYQRQRLPRSARRAVGGGEVANSGGGFGNLLPVAVGVGALGVPVAAGALYYQQVMQQLELEEAKRRIELQQKQTATTKAQFVPAVGGVAAVVLGMSVMSTNMDSQTLTPVVQRDESVTVLPAAAPPAPANVPPPATSAPLAATAPSVASVPIKPAEPPKPDAPKPTEVKQDAPKPAAQDLEVKPKAQPAAPATKPSQKPGSISGKINGQQNKAGLGVGAMVLIGAGAVLVQTAEEEEARAIA